MFNNITKRERRYLTEAQIDFQNRNGREMTNEELQETLKKFRNRA